MIIDTRQLPKHTKIQADICIIGAGAAGITLALELAGSHRQVCVLESGGFEPDPETQSLCEGKNIGLALYPLVAARLRYFGGTTNHWAGQCRPLDDADFETREWVPYSGWPFPKAVLEPYYQRAMVLCELGPEPFDGDFWAKRMGSSPLPLARDRFRTLTFRFSPPTRFGSRYRDAIEKTRHVECYLYANVLELVCSENGATVKLVRAQTLEGAELSVQAQTYVLAAGGLENPRLLLLSRDVYRDGIGNEHDLVGRFFMEHPAFNGGELRLLEGKRLPPLYDLQEIDGSHILGALGPAPEIQESEHILNYSVLLVPQGLFPVSQPDAAASKDATRTNDLADAVAAAASVLTDTRKKPIADKPDSATAGTKTVFWLRNRLEQAPNPASRITLSDERDALGLNRLRLDLRLTELEQRTLRRSQEILARELGRIGMGRLRPVPIEDPLWPSRVEGQWHHMGATRMHADPKQGVVDANCRVHRVNNLYLAGSSVFPTSGHANPTLTLVALAVRLAEHLQATA